MGCASPSPIAPAKRVTLPGGEAGIRLDDYFFDPEIKQAVVPAGRTGRLDFVNPFLNQVNTLGQFATPGPAADAGGPTSADGGDGLIFVTDRTDRQLYVVDARSQSVLSKTPLAAPPDYVRYVAPTHEVWVTEPHDRQIEVFSLGASSDTSLSHQALIASDHGGYEALAVDAARGRAYSNQGDTTVAIDLKTRTIAARWRNGCRGAEGLALDRERGFLIVACREGRAVALDVAHDGKRLSSVSAGSGIDIIAFSPARRHVYLPGSKSATLAIASLSETGRLRLLGTAPSVSGGHCVAADDAGDVWVCDPKAGGLLRFSDPFPASK